MCEMIMNFFKGIKIAIKGNGKVSLDDPDWRDFKWPTASAVEPFVAAVRWTRRTRVDRGSAIPVGETSVDQNTETQGHRKAYKGRWPSPGMHGQRMWRLPARIIKLTNLLYNKTNFKKKCRQCEKHMEVGKEIVTKKSFSTNRTFSRPSTKWYHVECAKRLNII